MINISLAILTAVLFSLAFSSFDLGWLAWFALLPLYISLENKSLRFSLALAFFAGLVFWSLTIYWLVYVTFLGQIILIFYLALYFGLFGAAVYLSRFLPALGRLLFLPATWVLLEYIRSYLFTGLPWALAGLSQYHYLAVIQCADITGAWGVSFLVVWVNTGLYLLWRKGLRQKILWFWAALPLIALSYGLIKLPVYSAPGNRQDKVKISVVQGNIPQELKWDSRALAFIQNRYQQLTLAAGLDKPQLIIWPEAAVPGLWGRDEDEFAPSFELAGQLKVSLLVGAVSLLEEDYFNSAVLIGPRGQATGIYHKLHLVPFGEYVPLKKILPFLGTIAPIGDITPGKEYTIFKLHPAVADRPVRAAAQAATFGVLICFEDLFPELSRAFVQRGAGFLVNITNDAWYKKSSAAFQHLAASVLRAVENRVYLVRCANTGVSGFIDPAGRVLNPVQSSRGEKIFIAGHRAQDIYLSPATHTIYNRYGDFFILLCLLWEAAAAVIFFRMKP